MEPTDHNMRAFDDLHRRRNEPRGGLPPIVAATLGDLTEKRVLHLRSGGGGASAELAQQGAVVTAVDPSEETVDAARERWPSILWIQADAQSLPAELQRGRFDLVYSPEGTLWELGDLDAWAAGIVAALQAHGELLVYDAHPVALCVDGLQRWKYDYFAEGFWRLGKIVTTLVRAGFSIEALEEYPAGSAGGKAADARPGEPAAHAARGERRLPGTFLLYARRV